MTSVVAKAIVSAVTGIFGSIAAIYYGFANSYLIVGVGTFLFTLMIQYNAIKIKFLVPVATALGLMIWALIHSGSLPR